MKTPELKRFSFPSLICGAWLIFLAVALRYIQVSSTIVFWAFLAVGFLCLLLSAFLYRTALINLFSRKSTAEPFSALPIYLTAIAFLFLIAINYLSIKHPLRLDVTKLKTHTLTHQTTQILQTLADDIKMTIFYVGIAPNYLADLLREYERFSAGRIQTEIVDPLVQLGYAAQFGSKITGDEKKAIVQSSKERKDIDFKDAPLTEEALTNAIVKVTRDKRKIYFLTGHDEFDIADKGPNGYSVLQSLLENSNSQTQTLFLAGAKQIPDDCNVLVIAGAKNQLPIEDENLIQQYLEKGGKALFLIESFPVSDKEHPLSESDKLKNPPLNRILNRWGIHVDDNVAVDLENHVGDDVGCPATRNYPAHKEIVNNLDYTFYIRPRSISVASNYPNTVKIAPLVFTSSKANSWAETDKNLHVKYDKDADIPGPVTIATVSWEPKSEKKSVDTKLIVFTDAEFATNNFINQYSNSSIILNSISWLSDLENLIAIPGKDIAVPKLNLTNKQLKCVVVILYLMPLLILTLGLWVWQKNRAGS